MGGKVKELKGILSPAEDESPRECNGKTFIRKTKERAELTAEYWEMRGFELNGRQRDELQYQFPEHWIRKRRKWVLYQNQFEESSYKGNTSFVKWKLWKLKFAKFYLGIQTNFIWISMRCIIIIYLRINNFPGLCFAYKIKVYTISILRYYLFNINFNAKSWHTEMLY